MAQHDILMLGYDLTIKGIVLGGSPSVVSYSDIAWRAIVDNSQLVEQPSIQVICKVTNNLQILTLHTTSMTPH